MSQIYDYIIIGSGPSGVQAAQTLVEKGKNVHMLDVGHFDTYYTEKQPDRDYLTLRESDPEQWRYLIGENFESLVQLLGKAGAQLTPARKFMLKDVELLTPVVTDTFHPIESLAKGGLGCGWGLGCYSYSDIEIKKVGLDTDKVRAAYHVVSDRIGISSGKDAVSPHTTGNLANILPPAKRDNSADHIYRRYEKKKTYFVNNGFYLGDPSMAILTRDLGERKAVSYNDTDFYSDFGKSLYRAWMTVDDLLKKPNFSYQKNSLVLKFKEEGNKVTISYLNTESRTTHKIEAGKLILAAGALGTARIILRSFPDKISSLPLLCNYYTYLPCLNLPMLMKPLSRNKTSMAQGMAIYDHNGLGDELVSIALFTYRSLMLFRLINESPLSYKDDIGIFNFLQSAFMIAGIHHPDEYYPEKKVSLVADNSSPTGDALKIDFKQPPCQIKEVLAKEKQIMKFLRKLGCMPIKRINLGHGSSIHYGGTLPFSENTNEPSTHPSGRINGTANVYIADGSGFKYLPAKGITFTLMANAHNVALSASNE